ncbi:hypothetical protein LEP1GSC158_3563 [Leptospira interrogans serovar Zanoni str. LT2156]|uniref:Uncharacterized protein n=1 Tax=Leptospira interrogans serovar Zanoni str. LT2156 TaxID=1001601 RepID=M6HRX7_LEPIR|nr:hypothetical protein LEP1GSC158_3563 [Leptospira interrogans serovar Zanoni str. LT2156]
MGRNYNFLLDIETIHFIRLEYSVYQLMWELPHFREITVKLRNYRSYHAFSG